MTDKPNQRSWKNYLIRRDLQLPIIAANLAFLAIVIALLIVVLLSPLYHDMLHAETMTVQNVSGRIFLILLERIALAMLLILVIAAGHQILLSHRFCGPLINFGHTFEKMARGDFTRKVHLRKRDFLKSEADRVNVVIDRLNIDGRQLDESMRRIAEVVEQLKTHAVPGEAEQLIGNLSEPVDRCRRILSAWTLKPND